MRRPLLAASFAIFAVMATATTSGCKPSGNVNNPSFADTRTAIDVYERLEALIDQQKDNKQIREDAYALVIERAGTDPDYYFARAAVAGRLAENRGLQALGHVTEAEDYARPVRAAHPHNREGSATRLLGSLYVLAPASLVQHGDSETGLEMLETEAAAHPDRIISRLRLAEAYIALNDPDPSHPHLCFVKQGQAKLGASDQRLLAKLLQDAGELKCTDAEQPGSELPAPATAPTPTPAAPTPAT